MFTGLMMEARCCAQVLAFPFSSCPGLCSALLSCGLGVSDAGQVSSHSSGAGRSPSRSQWERQNKNQRKVVVAARSLWLPCFPASYIAVTLTLLTYSKGYLLLEGSSRAGNFSRKPNFVCLVCSRADKGKVFVHEPVILRSQSAACCWCDTGHGMGVCWTAGVQRSGSLSSEPGLESTSLSNVSGVCLPTCPSAG